MKKLSIKNISTIFLTLCSIALLSVSCSSDDDSAPEDPVVAFTSFNVSERDVFIDKKITIELGGVGYTNLNITSNNPAVVITKKGDTTFEISSTTTANAYIYAVLNNNTKNASAGVNVSFNEHGVKNYESVEGIKTNIDTSTKVLNLLGEPHSKLDITSSQSGEALEKWRYPSKGLSVYIIKSSKIVQQIDMLSSNYFFTDKDGIMVNYTNYPYEIGNGWKINNAATTMDMVVTQLGNPSSKSTSATSSTNRTYNYVNKQLAFSFYSDSEDNYTGKKIIFFSLF